ncbi:hypothetical protein L914_21578 [Phytophthora nicotianae]|uniref:Crinkler effector protein N-terminal domain-containing protein n=2 Tax=Phytophthora nicotianae TaxID=4792 RepID=V9EBR6_PHYNI|nr:hypothetical protein F443_17336 [Phytophthora nicotianae P1569]ETM30747.1 hypothetical protein L914_21578 [Phytophthora nicotianae]
MVSLTCVLFGMKRVPFAINIGTDQSVGDLKKIIKAEKESDLEGVSADELRLWLANKGDDLLGSSADDAVALNISAQILGILNEELDSTRLVCTVFPGAQDRLAGENVIHLLVCVPQHYYHDSCKTIPQFTEYVHVRRVPDKILLVREHSSYGSHRHYFRAIETLNLFEAENRVEVNNTFGINGNKFNHRDTTSGDNEYFMALKTALTNSEYDGYQLRSECFIVCNKLKIFWVHSDRDNGDVTDEGGDGDEGDEGGNPEAAL